MKATDLDNVSADTRTDKVLDAYRYLAAQVEQIQVEMEILNSWLDQLPIRFITGSARVLTLKDIQNLKKSYADLCRNHDVYCAEFIIMQEKFVRMLHAARTNKDRSFQ